MKNSRNVKMKNRIIFYIKPGFTNIDILKKWKQINKLFNCKNQILESLPNEKYGKFD